MSILFHGGSCDVKFTWYQLKQLIYWLLLNDILVCVPLYLTQGTINGLESINIVEEVFEYLKVNLNQLNIKKQLFSISHCVGTCSLLTNLLF